MTVKAAATVTVTVTVISCTPFMLRTPGLTQRMVPQSGKRPAAPSNRPQVAMSMSSSDGGDVEPGDSDIALESFSDVLSRSLDALETR